MSEWWRRKSSELAAHHAVVELVSKPGVGKGNFQRGDEVQKLGYWVMCRKFMSRDRASQRTWRT